MFVDFRYDAPVDLFEMCRGGRAGLRQARQLTAREALVAATSLDHRIQHYLTEALDAAVVRVGEVRRLLGGSTRELLEVHAEWGASEADLTRRDLVVRLDPVGSLLESNRAVEYAMHRGFWAVPGVPVAEPLLIEDDPAPLGRPFYVMGKVAGTASSSALLSAGYAAVRPLIFAQVMEILGIISAADYRELGLAAVLATHRPDESWRIELERWEQVMRKHDTGPRPVTEMALRYLKRTPPPPPRRLSVVHGDYRIGNILFGVGGVQAVLDWEMAHLGDPHEDLAWLMSRNYWPGGTDQPGSGVPTREEALMRWEAASGMRADPGALRWWRLFTHVKATAIWMTGGHRVVTGESTQLRHAMAHWSVDRQEMWMIEDMGLAS
jgi:aminoglycoside phosphotransferase (APT) family kinase protein